MSVTWIKITDPQQFSALLSVMGRSYQIESLSICVPRFNLIRWRALIGLTFNKKWQ